MCIRVSENVLPYMTPTTIVMYFSAREVIAQSNQLLEAARNAINNPNNPDNQQRLQQVWEGKP